MLVRAKKGFTLIELLVVIAIIGILAALIVVNLSKARVKARDAKRMSDVRELSTAVAMYVDDNGTAPACGSGFGSVGQKVGQSVCLQDLVTGSYISTLPTPPSGGSETAYFFDSRNGGIVGIILENQATGPYVWTSPNPAGDIEKECATTRYCVSYK